MSRSPHRSCHALLPLLLLAAGLVWAGPAPKRKPAAPAPAIEAAPPGRKGVAAAPARATVAPPPDPMAIVAARTSHPIPEALAVAEVALTEPMALSLFFRRNLDLIAARYDVETARAEEIVAAAIPNPTLGVDEMELSRRMDFRNHVGSPGPATMVRVDQLIELAGKRGLRKEKSALGREAAELDLKDALRIFSTAVRRSFYNLLLTQYIRDLAAEQAQRYQDLLVANKNRLKAGDISESDFLRIEVEGLKAQADVDNATAEREKARADLAVLLSWPEEARRFRAAGIWPHWPDPVDTVDEEVLLERGLATRPDLAASRTRIAAAEKELSLAHARRVPDVTVGLGYAHDPSNNVLNTAILGVSVPLPIFYQNQGEIGRALIGVDSATLQSRQKAQAMRGELVGALARWKGAKTVAERYGEEILSRITKVREVAEFAYHKGATSIIDLIQAERDYKATMQEFHRAMANRTLAHMDLQSVLGEVPENEASAAPDGPSPTRKKVAPP